MTSLSMILHKNSSISELFIEACSGRKFLLSFFFIILFLSWCDAGILVNKDGIPEEEENFDEAIRAVNMALVPTRVRSRKKTISIKLCCSFRTTLFCQLI